jgi:hypothetical protein
LLLLERKGYNDKFSQTTLRYFDGTARDRLVQDLAGKYLIVALKKHPANFRI